MGSFHNLNIVLNAFTTLLEIFNKSLQNVQKKSLNSQNRAQIRYYSLKRKGILIITVNICYILNTVIF